MRQLLPEPAEVDVASAHAEIRRHAPVDRPWVMLNVVTSADGATAVDGVSAGLGSPADKEVFSALRAVADVVMAGAGTVTAERYRPPRTGAAQQARRLARGQRARPRIAVVSGSLSVPLDLELFGDPAERPIVVTTVDADADRLAEVRAVAEVVQAGQGTVDLRAALAALRAHGDLVLCEGGSNLNGRLLADDLVDEINVSYSPLVVGGTSPRLASGPVETARPLALAHLWEAEHMLLARYVAVRAG